MIGCVLVVQVYDVIRRCTDAEGVSVQSVSESLRGMPQKAIRSVKILFHRIRMLSYNSSVLLLLIGTAMF